MRFILGITLGLALGIGAYWFITSGRDSASREKLARQVSDAATTARRTLDTNLASLDLHSEQIKKELARSGQVVRTKAQQAGQAISDATTDARITAAVKTKILASRELSAGNISVSTSQGVVTLSGIVGSADQIGRAIEEALDTHGVIKVVSKLQVAK